MSYDEKCYALANSFIQDSLIPVHNWPTLTKQLAQEIQDSIEGFLSEHEEETGE
jgi:hypothetical protein